MYLVRKQLPLPEFAVHDSEKAWRAKGLLLDAQPGLTAPIAVRDEGLRKPYGLASDAISGITASVGLDAMALQDDRQ